MTMKTIFNTETSWTMKGLLIVFIANLFLALFDNYETMIILSPIIIIGIILQKKWSRYVIILSMFSSFIVGLAFISVSYNLMRALEYWIPMWLSLVLLLANWKEERIL